MGAEVIKLLFSHQVKKSQSLLKGCVLSIQDTEKALNNCWGTAGKCSLCSTFLFNSVSCHLICFWIGGLVSVCAPWACKGRWGWPACGLRSSAGLTWAGRMKVASSQCRGSPTEGQFAVRYRCSSGGLWMGLIDFLLLGCYMWQWNDSSGRLLVHVYGLCSTQSLKVAINWVYACWEVCYLIWRM